MPEILSNSMNLRSLECVLKCSPYVLRMLQTGQSKHGWVTSEVRMRSRTGVQNPELEESAATCFQAQINRKRWKRTWRHFLSALKSGRVVFSRISSILYIDGTAVGLVQTCHLTFLGFNPQMQYHTPLIFNASSKPTVCEFRLAWLHDKFQASEGL